MCFCPRAALKSLSFYLPVYKTQDLSLWKPLHFYTLTEKKLQHLFLLPGIFVLNQDNTLKRVEKKNNQKVEIV